MILRRLFSVKYRSGSLGYQSLPEAIDQALQIGDSSTEANSPKSKRKGPFSRKMLNSTLRLSATRDTATELVPSAIPPNPITLFSRVRWQRCPGMDTDQHIGVFPLVLHVGTLRGLITIICHFCPHSHRTKDDFKGTPAGFHEKR